MRKVLFFSLVVILISGLILGGCAKSTTTPASTTTPTTTKASPTATTTTAPATTTAATTTAAAPKPQSGGILKIIYTPGITNMGVPGQPFTVGDMVFARCAVESLLDLDAKGNIIPWLATGWQYSADYKSLTLTLRKGVKFHDGTDFNAEAVKYCLDLAKPGRPDLSKITSVEVVDPYTVKLNIEVFEPRLLIVLCGLSGKIVSPTSLKTSIDAAKTHPVGTGPFEYESYQRDVSLKFKKFAGYWQPGKPYLDGMEFVFIADAVTRLVSFKAGEAQVLGTVVPKDASELVATGKYGLNKTPSSVMGVAGDSAHTSSPFSDIKVRQAIAYAIDNEAIAKAMGYGIYQATNQFSAPGHYSYNPAVVGYPYNPQKAKDLLAAAGYSKGLTTKLTCQAQNQAIYTAVLGYLKDVGIDTTMDIADSGRWVQIQTGGWNNSLISYDISHSYGLDKGDSLSSRVSSKSTQYPITSFWVPAVFEEKLNAANAERDEKKRATMIQEMMKMITDEYCLAIPIYTGFGMAVYKSPEVHDMDMNVLANHIWHPADAWLSK